MYDLAELPDELYLQLKRLAAYKLKAQRYRGTLNCTALVHEAFIKLQSSSNAPEQADEQHYLALISLAMRQILVDYIRGKNAEKRGGQVCHVTLQDHRIGQQEPEIDLLVLDEALENLGKKDKLLEQVVILRFFAGLTNEQTASALGRSVRSAERDWARARAYLFKELEETRA